EAHRAAATDPEPRAQPLRGVRRGRLRRGLARAVVGSSIGDRAPGRRHLARARRRARCPRVQVPAVRERTPAGSGRRDRHRLDLGVASRAGARRPALRTDRAGSAPGPARYITAKVSYTVMLAPPWSTGQPLALLTASSSESAVRIE